MKRVEGVEDGLVDGGEVGEAYGVRASGLEDLCSFIAKCSMGPKRCDSTCGGIL